MIRNDAKLSEHSSNLDSRLRSSGSFYDKRNKIRRNKTLGNERNDDPSMGNKSSIGAVFPNWRLPRVHQVIAAFQTKCSFDEAFRWNVSLPEDIRCGALAPRCRNQGLHLLTGLHFPVSFFLPVSFFAALVHVPHPLPPPKNDNLLFTPLSFSCHWPFNSFHFRSMLLSFSAMVLSFSLDSPRSL